MRYLLDTNILSELFKPAPHRKVAAWVRGESSLDLTISVLVIGEIEKGIALLPAGARRTVIEQWAHNHLPRQFAGRLLPVSPAIALAWGRLAAAGRERGRPLPVVDGIMLATAMTHDLTLVTRNVADCAGRGVAVLDPWTGDLHR